MKNQIEIKEEKEKSDNEILNNNNDNEKEKNKIKELNNCLELLENQKKELSNQLLSSKDKIQEMKIKINDLENQIKINKIKPNELQKNEKNNNNSNQNEPSQNEIKLIEKIKELNNKNQVLENNIIQLQLELNNVNNKNNKLNNYFSKERNESAELRKKTRSSSSDVIINNKLEEFRKTYQEHMKEKNIEIKDLKQENIELKNKLEKTEETRNNIKLKESEIFLKSEEYENKIKFLEERKNYYENIINDLKEKIRNLENINNILKKEKENIIQDKKLEFSIIKGEYESTKKELEEYKNRINNDHSYLSNNINDFPDFSPETHIIICDKNYNNLQWFLLGPKEINIKTLNLYNNLCWIEKPKIINELDKYNKFISEMDEENQRIKNTIMKLEEKDNIINNLTIQIKKLNKSKQNNTLNEGELSFKSEPFNKKNHTKISGENYLNFSSFSYLNKDKGNNNTVIVEGIPLEKFNLVLKKLNDSEKRNQLLQEDYLKLKRDINEKKHFENNLSFIHEKNNSDFIDEEVQEVVSEISEEKITKKSDKNVIPERLNIIKESDDNNLNFNEELYNTKNQLILIKSLYKDLENTFQKIKNEIQSFFTNLIVKQNEIEQVKNILSLLNFKKNEINNIIYNK